MLNFLIISNLNRYFFQLAKKLVFITITLISLNWCNAQQKTNTFWNNVRFGGGIGLSFGDNFFSGTLAPSALYQFDNTVALGIGLSGTINNQKNAYKSTILGGSLISLFNIIPQLQASAEYEQLHVNRNFDAALNIEDDTYWIPALYIGAGYRNGNVTFGIRYDILHDSDKSITVDPWAPFVRVYF